MLENQVFFNSSKLVRLSLSMSSNKIMGQGGKRTSLLCYGINYDLIDLTNVLKRFYLFNYFCFYFN
jgi:hypothetical protein